MRIFYGFFSVLRLLCLCAHLFLCALWSPAGKGLTLGPRLWCLTVNLSLSHWILGPVWYLIVSIPDFCTLTYFENSSIQAYQSQYYIAIYQYISIKVFDKRDDFDFEIANFPFLDGDVPWSTSYGVYISQLIRFARASRYITDFNNRNKLITHKLLKQGYQYHKLRKTFLNFIDDTLI